MVTMVYPRDAVLAEKIKRFRLAGREFDGPRTFVQWENAVAYALLPADPNITTAPRRRVRKGSSGRWLVEQTFASGQVGSPRQRLK